MAGGRLTLEAATGRMKGSYGDSLNSFSLEMEKRADAPEQPNKERPSHDVLMLTRSGELVKCGALWTHEAKEGANRGMKYFRFSVDDPNLSQTLWLTAFPVMGKDKKFSATDFEVVWRRDQRAAA